MSRPLTWFGLPLVMIPPRLLLFVTLGLAGVLGTTGCANLAAVRDFAAEAKVSSANPSLSRDLVGTQIRLQALYGREESAETNALHEAYREKFAASQDLLVKYMAALEAVADPAVIDYQKEVAAVSAASQKAGLLEEADAKRWASAGQLIARLATDGARKKLLSETVKECDPALQTLVRALVETLQEDYLSSLEAERKAVQSLLADVERSGNPGVVRLAHFSLREHRLSLEAREKSTETYVAALRKVGEAHQKLAQNVGDLSRKEWVAELKGYQSELKQLQAALRN